MSAPGRKEGSPDQDTPHQTTHLKRGEILTNSILRPLSSFPDLPRPDFRFLHGPPKALLFLLLSSPRKASASAGPGRSWTPVEKRIIPADWGEALHESPSQLLPPSPGHPMKTRIQGIKMPEILGFPQPIL